MENVKKSTHLTACVCYTIALISGGIGIFAYSPFDYWIVAFLSASGLIWLSTFPIKRIALVGTFLWAVSYFAIGVNWVHVSMIQFGGVPEIASYFIVLALAIYLALYPLLFTYLAQRFKVKNPWLLASIFTLTEYLRGVVFTGFPWLQFGYSQIDSPFFNLATLFGVEGLTFFVIVVSGYLVQIFYQLAKKHCDRTACIICLVVLIGAFTTRYFQSVQIDSDKTPIKITLIQGNIEQKIKWNPEYLSSIIMGYYDLLQQSLGKSDVVILPESAIPAIEENIEMPLSMFDKLAKEKGSKIIIGTLFQSHQRELYNSAVLLGETLKYSAEHSPRYYKHHLVPFGEYVPFGHLLDWLREVFILPINLSQGSFIQPALKVNDRKFNLAICYEIIFGDQVQQNQKIQQSDYLLTISNDAWFGESSGPWQHFQMARMRALELGKPLVRATNTGVTAFVNFDGKVISMLPQFEVGTLTEQILTTKGETVYGQFGRSLLYGLCWLISIFAIAWKGIRKDLNNK
ncbi:apolipoprotein N-acyltransferase [Vespertiliibacter pulmonis]|uniref:Apolipoprotein N-acyltransferase n=1 Tax=Vespertiliibacter pulmonis TaxID=1443036 RepID=A0A3N4WJP4_9PAST|nr:apolipoprotein N-acyltransferase [Vespertiliibacter pulmonis]QLB20186.1 apolipoprotein N-acyltransferase [Vespertiliibacter pulmonis]RPE86160.1 apolipoprotein N-acyltransferase [Vespertiliibacter pulmonis]